MRRGLVAAALLASASVIAAAAPAAAQVKGASIARGKLLFLQCRACHTVARGDPNKVGPNLFGLFDRPAATAPGFRYSAALKSAAPVWNDATLDRWLAAPAKLAPGTTMAFAGMALEADRRSIIAYLRSTTIGGTTPQ